MLIMEIGAIKSARNNSTKIINTDMSEPTVSRYTVEHSVIRN